MKKIITRLREVRKKKNLNKKINSVVRRNKDISSYRFERKQKKEIEDLWSDFGFKININWHRAYIGINQTFDPKYIPEDVFYMYILPRLGNLSMSKSYADKNMYDRLFENFNKPKTIVRNIHGRCYNTAYDLISTKDAEQLLIQNEGEYIIKPTIETSQGKGVQKLKISNGEVFCNGELSSFETLCKLYKKDFLVQEAVKQNSLLNEIYPNSLNTIRMMTLRHKNSVNVISSVLRLGNNGLEVDNYTLGGIAVGVNESGVLNTFGMDKHFNKYYEHPYTKKSFDNIAIPDFNKAVEMVQDLHEKILYFDLISWDIALNNVGEFVFIEVNLGGQEINFHQANNGPLFGKMTENIVKDTLSS